MTLIGAPLGLCRGGVGAFRPTWSRRSLCPTCPESRVSGAATLVCVFLGRISPKPWLVQGFRVRLLGTGPANDRGRKEAAPRSALAGQVLDFIAVQVCGLGAQNFAALPGSLAPGPCEAQKRRPRSDVVTRALPQPFCRWGSAAVTVRSKKNSRCPAGQLAAIACYFWPNRGRGRRVEMKERATRKDRSARAWPGGPCCGSPACWFSSFVLLVGQTDRTGPRSALGVDGGRETPGHAAGI